MTAVTPTSAAQLAAVREGSVPPLEEVQPGVHTVGLSVAPGFAGLCHLVVGDDDLTVIDPGTAVEGNRRILADAFAALGRRESDVTRIIVTHLHPDHLGGAAPLRAASGARLVLHRIEQRSLVDDALGPEPDPDRWGVPDDRRPELDRSLWRRSPGDAEEPRSSIRADDLVDDGDVIDVPGHPLEVLHTPGHTAGSICLRDAGSRLLFTGDHVLPGINPGLGLGGSSPDPIGDYLASLERVRALDDHEVLPGHGYRFTGLAARCDELARHHRVRSDEVAAARSEGSVWRIAQRVSWTNGFDSLHGFVLASALAQVEGYLRRLERLDG